MLAANFGNGTANNKPRAARKVGKAGPFYRGQWGDLINVSALTIAQSRYSVTRMNSAIRLIAVCIAAIGIVGFFKVTTQYIHASPRLTPE